MARRSLTLLIASSLMVCNAAAAPVPKSTRADGAVERYLPKVSRSFADRGVEVGAPLYVRIFKRERELEIWGQTEAGPYVRIASFPVCAYSGRLGPKLSQGDGQAPEGFYEIRSEQLNPKSSFHLAFDIGYPNAYDRAHGRNGSLLMVHGDCVSTGCYAMTDDGIEEIYTYIYAALALGAPPVPIHLFPFRMTEANMNLARNAPWIDFWHELEPAYTSFEETLRPPRIIVESAAYKIESSY